MSDEPPEVKTSDVDARDVDAAEGRARLSARLRAETPIVIGYLVRLLGDLGAAEEVFQETSIAAVARFSNGDLPEYFGAWLMTSAKRRGIDWLRRERRLSRLTARFASEMTDQEASYPTAELLPDEPLRLMILCCDPALPLEAQVALTLRYVAGLTTAEVARAFLLSEPTAAQRLVRAKKSLAALGHGPGGSEPEPSERLEAVLLVIYLIFNEGYAAASGPQLTRDSLAAEALRLVLLVTQLAAKHSAAWALFALLELQIARFPARTNAAGELVLIEHQDRSLWDRALLRRGLAHLERARRLGGVSRYLFEAEIAACHACAEHFDATDWRGIERHYLEYEESFPSPVLTLNRAVAVAMTDGPDAAIGLLEQADLREALADYFPYHATRADFERRRGDFRAAQRAYARALELASNEPERAFSELRLAECRAQLTEPS
jgi:RNA polymerase sigma factor (sigma-70 family)